ncbi:unnamed protein product [Sphagnum jensenii]
MGHRFVVECELPQVGMVTVMEWNVTASVGMVTAMDWNVTASVGMVTIMDWNVPAKPAHHHPWSAGGEEKEEQDLDGVR